MIQRFLTQILGDLGPGEYITFSQTNIGIFKMRFEKVSKSTDTIYSAVHSFSAMEVLDIYGDIEALFEGRVSRLKGIVRSSHANAARGALLGVPKEIAGDTDNTPTAPIEVCRNEE